MTNIHLGCGEKYLKGYLHIDINDGKHIDYKTDVRDLHMFEDNSVDKIYSSHTLEYFNREEVVSVLEEWKRVLKPGGVLLLAVPNFESIVKVYQEYKDINHRGILGPLFGKWSLDNGETIYHKTTYDFRSLKILLESIEFKKIMEFDPFKEFGEDFDDYSKAYIPHLDKNGIAISLNISALK